MVEILKNLGCATRPFSFSRLLLLPFPLGNRRLPDSALLGVECHSQPDAKQRALRWLSEDAGGSLRRQQAAPEDGLRFDT
jgi:hypothetical protein